MKRQSDTSGHQWIPVDTSRPHETTQANSHTATQPHSHTATYLSRVYSATVELPAHSLRAATYGRIFRAEQTQQIIKSLRFKCTLTVNHGDACKCPTVMHCTEEVKAPAKLDRRHRIG